MATEVAPAGERRRPRLLQLGAPTSTCDRSSIAALLVVIGLDMDATLSAVAGVASAYFLAYGPLQPVWGVISDRIGRVRVLRLSLLGATLAGLGSVLAPKLRALGIWRTVAGACFADPSRWALRPVRESPVSGARVAGSHRQLPHFAPCDPGQNRGVHTASDELSRGPVVPRRWQGAADEILYRAVSESFEHLSPWMAWAARGYSTADAVAYIARTQEVRGTDYDYAIVAPGPALVGSCSMMSRIEPGGFEIRYWAHPAHLGRDYATSAAAALTSEAFRTGADRVGVHDLANVASRAIPRRLGFREVDRRAPQEGRPATEVGVDVVWRLSASRSRGGMTVFGMNGHL